MPLIGRDVHDNNDSYGYHGIVHEMDAKCHMHPQILYILFGYISNLNIIIYTDQLLIMFSSKPYI